MNVKTRNMTIIVIAIIIVGILFISVTQIGTDFNVENRSVNDEEYYIWIRDVADCNVSVSFVEDANLFYAFNVGLSSSAFGSSSYSVEIKPISHQVIFRGSDLVDSVHLTLGSSMHYSLVVVGQNLNTTIAFSNGALIDGMDVGIYHTGFLHFNIDEDVIATGDLDVTIGASTTDTPSLIYLDIDLPTGMNGVMNFKADSSVSIRENIGWYLRQPPFDRIEYSTSASEPSPLLSIYAMQKVASVQAWLSN